MILTDADIRKEVKNGNIEISGFDEKFLGSNSYDLTLGSTLLVYTEDELDAKKDNPHRLIHIPEEGYVLDPNEFYLGTTREYTKSKRYAPFIEGKSSIGRLGMAIHITAGFGDIGFAGHWTLEITVEKKLRIYPGMPVAQIWFLLPLGECTKPYSMKREAKYQNQDGVPVASKMWKNFINQPAL